MREGELYQPFEGRLVRLLPENRKNVSGNHRGRLDIIADILEASYGGTKKTYLMYRCNMSFRQLKYYLNFLIGKELIYTFEENVKNDPGLFKTTSKGLEFLKAYKGLKSLVKA